MKFAKPILNVQNARAEYIKSDNGDSFHNSLLGFSHYSPSYVLTNEDIRWVSGLTQNKGPRVLTVAASGDHPMFYAMRGATNIDTFDISFCAKVAMDIKTAAIQKLSRDEYVQLLNDMHQAQRISDVKSITELMPDIPQNSAYFIQQMGAYPIFSNGLNPSYYKETIPTDAEYAKMRENIRAPFKFIWSDIKSLHTNLTDEYDVINLSNIFEYMTPQQIHQTLAALRNHVRPGGAIIAQTGNWGINRNARAYCDAAKKFKRWARVGYCKKEKDKANSEMIAVVQRTR